MARFTADQIVTQQQKRFFLQDGGAGPANPVLFGGVDGQAMIVTGVTKPFGSTDPIRIPDPHRLGQYRTVARSNTPADDPTATIVFLEDHGRRPRAFDDSGCPLALYEVTGRCKDPSDFLGGWEDYVLIYANGEKTDLDAGDRGAWEDDNQIENSVDVTFSDIYTIGAIAFVEQAANEISREVIDAVYGPAASCGYCGPGNDGTKRLYAVTKSSGSGSPGLPGELVYTLDGGASWTEAAIASLGATEDPKAIRVVGDKLLVLTATAYYWATINQFTGAPGVFTKVTTGFNAAAPFNDVFALNPREIFFVANSGYIYKSTDLAGGVSTISNGAQTARNLLRIHGDALSGTLYAVGEQSTILISLDRGRTWATAVGTIPTTVASAQAVAVRDALRAWVGTSSGRVFYTLDGGENWIEKVFGSNLNIRDIVFATEEVGYIAYDDASTTAYLLSTWNGGADWALNGSGPRVRSLPTMDRVNRVAVPVMAPSGTAANYLALAALHGSGTDGLLALGASPSK